MVLSVLCFVVLRIAIVSKIPKGHTLIELVLVMGIVSILFAVVVLNVNPLENKQNARDQKRMSDLQLLDRVVNEYLVDKKTLPTSLSTDLSEYTVKIPVDPIDDAIYYYQYAQNVVTYELSAVLENSPDISKNDGGNDDDAYELGNDLTLISP